MNGRKILVAGIGNIFFSDDGFGPEVVRRMLAEDPPVAGVHVEDYGIRGMHLAYELLNGYDAAIFVDAISRRAEPGTLFVFEPDTDVRGVAPDAHSMDVRNVFATLKSLEGTPPPIVLLGCEPADVDEGMGLSPVVAAAVETALPRLRALIQTALTTTNKEISWSAV